MLDKLISQITTLYGIHKRQIDRDNDVLSQRKQLASELNQNCRLWARILLDTFNEAVRRWTAPGTQPDSARRAALDEIIALEQDFLKLDYWSLEDTSPILKFLREDDRFAAFAGSCAHFYKSALRVKRITYDDIQATDGGYVAMHRDALSDVVRAWESEVERMMQKVSHEYHAIQTLLPR